MLPQGPILDIQKSRIPFFPEQNVTLPFEKEKAETISKGDRRS
jgi:hypothetical protein